MYSNHYIKSTLRTDVFNDAMCMRVDGNTNKEDEEMANAAEKLTELRKVMKSVNKDIPVLKYGKKDAIELDSENFLHRRWYEGR